MIDISVTVPSWSPTSTQSPTSNGRENISTNPASIAPSVCRAAMPTTIPRNPAPTRRLPTLSVNSPTTARTADV